MREAMAADAELVHLLAGHTVLPRDQLGGDALGHEVIELGQLWREWRARRDCVGAHRHAAHRLDSAGDGHVAHTRLDEVGREMNGLLARSALAVNRGRGRREWKAGGQPRVASDVEALLAGLAHAAKHDVIDLARLDARAPHELLQHQRGEDDGVNVLELAVAPADGRTDGLDDYGFTHLSTPSRWLCAHLTSAL